MLRKIMCLFISVLLSFSILITAYAVESKTLRDVCENEKTFEAIEAMTEADELELYVILKCPETENISCASQNLSPEEFEAKVNGIYETYKNFCYKFIEDYSIITPTYCSLSTMFICKLTLKDIENIMNDERLEGFSVLESGIEADGTEAEYTDTDINIDDAEIDTDETWTSYIDGNGNLIVPGGGTSEVWRNYIEDYALTSYIDEEGNLIIPENSASKLWRGDANDDGSLDMLDVTVTQKFIAEIDSKCNTELADMDKSGIVDLQDVVQMQKTIADII